MTALAERWATSTQQALGTSVHVLVTEPALLADATTLVARGLAALDAACSRFRPDSELSRLPAGGGTVAVSPLLAAAIAAALEVAELTDGLVDPTLGAALRAVGYDRTFAALPADGPAAVRLPAPRDRWRQVVVEGAEVTLPAGAELDLGASAKAWAADRLAARVAELGTGALVNLGGDLAVAGPAPAGGWPVEVRDRPHDGTALQTVAVAEGGLATSSTTARTWQRGGRLLHHVLDPATGLPAAPVWRSVSVVAADCLTANAASTAALVLGAGAPAWLAALGLPACLLAADGTVTRLNGWPQP